MYTEKHIHKKLFTNRQNIALPCRFWVELTAHGMETHRLTSKENIQGAAVSKESHNNSVGGHVRTHHNWLSWKEITSNCKLYFLKPNL